MHNPQPPKTERSIRLPDSPTTTESTIVLRLGNNAETRLAAELIFGMYYDPDLPPSHTNCDQHAHDKDDMINCVVSFSAAF